MIPTHRSLQSRPRQSPGVSRLEAGFDGEKVTERRDIYAILVSNFMMTIQLVYDLYTPLRSHSVTRPLGLRSWQNSHLDRGDEFQACSQDQDGRGPARVSVHVRSTIVTQDD